MERVLETLTWYLRWKSKTCLCLGLRGRMSTGSRGVYYKCLRELKEIWIQWKCFRNCGFIVQKNIERTLCVYIGVGIFFYFKVKFNIREAYVLGCRDKNVMTLTFFQFKIDLNYVYRDQFTPQSNCKRHFVWFRQISVSVCQIKSVPQCVAVCWH